LHSARCGRALYDNFNDRLLTAIETAADLPVTYGGGRARSFQTTKTGRIAAAGFMRRLPSRAASFDQRAGPRRRKEATL
jgi:hypothetical protein